jgi:wyosine [tRNA(Phe)-imidazoG37] synthetase (radical SAM superfamily)
MSSNLVRHVYGPVPSRRLGRSLGIDLVPLKTCTYDCVYCQLGRTTTKTIERRRYVAVDEVLDELERALGAGDAPDYISLAGSGEPTLNEGLGELIGRIKELTDIPVAVLTNGSLLWMSEVRDALMSADLVLPSLDAGDELMFRYVNRPHEGISFDAVVEGIIEFTRRFQREVWLEVFLLAGVTGIPSEARKIAALVRWIGPARIQLNTVSRPPAEQSAVPISTKQMRDLAVLFSGTVDFIRESRRGETAVTAAHKARASDILALLRRRPCTLEDVSMGLGIHCAEALKYLEKLMAAAKVETVVAGGRTFYTVEVPEKVSLRDRRSDGQRTRHTGDPSRGH